jgi:hypothetical protein
MDDDNEHDGADRGGREGVNETAGASADFQFAENPSAKHGTNEAEENVGQATVAAAARDFSGEPPGNETEQNPANEAAINDYAKDLIYIREE